MIQEIDLNYLSGNASTVFRKLASQRFTSDFLLVGGTALAMQIRHRLSMDLDLLVDTDVLHIAQIKRNIGKIFPKYRITRQDHPWQIDFWIDEVRVTFFSSGAIAVPLGIGKHSFRENQLNIATPRLIAALKFSAIAQRNTIRDYYDLYMLARYHIPLLELIIFTRELLPNLSPVTYTETLVYTKDIDESSIASHLSPAEIIDKEEIAAYFTQELSKIKDRI